jgi:hypothetical protein
MINRVIYMGILTGILSFFGCSGQTKKAEGELSKVTKEQLDQSIEAFKNRPVHKELTEHIIDATSNDNILQVVFDNLSAKLPADYKKEYECVMTWNKSRQAIYMIWALEAEVNNGGYNQFYFNSSGQFYKYLPEALRLVGANKFADLTQQANNIFEMENNKITKHQGGTIEGFSKSYDDNSLNNLDTKFYELYKTENLLQIQVDYIRKNKKDFIDK